MLTPQEVEELNQSLSDMRHDVANHLMIISACLEMAKRDPQSREQRLAMLSEQPGKICEQLANFSAEFERQLKITRPTQNRL